MPLSFPLVWDSSMLALLKACPQKFYLTHIQQWKAKGQSVHLHAGGAFAHGIETAREAFFVNGDDADTAVAKGFGALLNRYGAFQCPPDSAKSAERTAGALEYYFANYPLDHESYPPVTLPSGKKGIEFSFAHPIDLSHPDTNEPLIYCGRLDALLHLNGHDPAAYITDEKTTSSLGASWGRQWDLRSQFTGYTWGCGRSGIRVDGVIVRGVSILKTKYDTQQVISARTEYQVERWYDELLDWIDGAKQAWLKGKWRHNLDHTCSEYGGCEYTSACTSSDKQPWLETYFERRHWDPIQRTELPVEV